MFAKNRCTYRLDYISATNVFNQLDECEAVLTAISAFVPNGERWAYLNPGRANKRLKSVSGLVGWLRLQPDGLCHLRIELPGQFCKSVEQIPLCQYLESNRFRITRLDVCLDDYVRRVNFETVKAAGDCGYYRLVSSFKSIQSAVMVGIDARENRESLVGTCYFGNSDKILRFYNAEAVHGIEADRWELQLRNELAQSAFNVYLEDPTCLPTFVTGSVDFGTLGNHYDNFRRFQWWQSLIDEVGNAVPVPRTPYHPDLTRSIDWLARSVAPTLAVLRFGLGDCNFETLLSHICYQGFSRLKPYHRQWIEAIKESEIDVIKLVKDIA